MGIGAILVLGAFIQPAMAEGDTPRSAESAKTTAREREAMEEAMEQMKALESVKTNVQLMNAQLTKLTLQEKARKQNDIPAMTAHRDALVAANDHRVSNSCKGALDKLQNDGIFNAAMNAFTKLPKEIASDFRNLFKTVK